MKPNIPHNQIPIYDLYDLWYTPFWHAGWFWPSIIILLLIVVSIVLFFIIKKNRLKKAVLNPQQRALYELNRIELYEFKDPVTHKKFYSVLTHTLKEYFGYQYSLLLASKTDQEALEMLQTMQDLQTSRTILSDIFQGSLLVKFANQQAALEKMRQDLACAKKLIMDSKKIEKANQ